MNQVQQYKKRCLEYEDKSRKRKKKGKGYEEETNARVAKCDEISDALSHISAGKIRPEIDMRSMISDNRPRRTNELSTSSKQLSVKNNSKLIAKSFGVRPVV